MGLEVGCRRALENVNEFGSFEDVQTANSVQEVFP
jgi:hypothetical protein